MRRIYSVSLTKNFFSETVMLPQYDEKYQLTFKFVNNEYKSSFDGKSAYFEGTRSDGLSFRYSTIVSGNTATFVIDRALTAVSGEHKGQIVLYDGAGLRFGSSNVKILVEKAARPDNAIDADVTSQQTLLEQLQEIVDTAAETTTAAAQQIVDDLNVSDYNGVVSGTTLASNNKVGFYSVGGFSTTVVSHMTDMPCDDFAGGYLLNTHVGSAGTTVRQTLVEINSGTTLGRTFSRTIGYAWVGVGYVNWVAFGDSITHGSYSDAQGNTLNNSRYSYAYRIAKNLRREAVAQFYNCGVRGIGWVNTGNNGETFADMMALFTGDKTAINLVTIMLGINDYLSLETLGTTSSAENDGTISGAIRYGLRYLCENYPNAKIIAISPLNSMNHGSASTGWSRNTRLTLPGSLQDVCDMIAYWCNVYNVTYINEISESFLNNYNISTYLKDNLHPTDEGQWMLARELSRKIFV